MKEITSIKEHLATVRAEAKALSGKDPAKAESLLRGLLKRLIAGRSNYVNWRRSIGAVLGGLTGYLLTLLIPGGSELTLLGSIFGTGLLGERVGRYTGERLSEEEYRLTLVTLHRELLDLYPDPDRQTFARLRRIWRGLVVLETPLDLFTPFFEGQTSWLRQTITAIKSFVGFDPYRLAVEQAKPRFQSWSTLVTMAGHINRLGAYGKEARFMAVHMYRKEADDLELVRMLGYFYYLDMVNYERLKETHRQRYGQELVDFFLRHHALEPESNQAVSNLAQAYLEERWYTSDTLPVYRAAIHRMSDALPVAAALCRCLDFGEGCDAYQTVVKGVLDGERRALEEGLIRPEELLGILASRARWIVRQKRRDQEARTVLSRIFKHRRTREGTLWLARIYLEGKMTDDLMAPLMDEAYRALDLEAFPAPDNDWPAETLASLANYLVGPGETLPSEPAKLIRGAALAMAVEDWQKAIAYLDRLKSDYNLHRSLSAEQKLFLSHQLGRAYRSLGELHRAFEYFKSVALVVPSDALLADVFSFGLEVRDRGDKPSLARNAFLLIKSCKADYVSPEARPIDDYIDTLKNVFDHYKQDSLRKIGGGGMAVIFSGLHRESGQLHVIKQLRTDFGTEQDMAEFRKLFSSEIRAIKRINESDHPGSRHVVVLYHESADENSYCYSMEALDTILSDRLREKGRFEDQEARRLLEQILLGLACAHKEGVIHRDLNPRNIGFKGDTVKIFDFGTAHVLRTTLHLAPAPKVAGYQREDHLILGTPRYMSPEQAAGKSFDERTDLFAVGCVAFELLTGEIAFPGQMGSQILSFDESYPEELARRLARHGSEDIAGPILACLARDPAARPPSAEGLVEALRRD